MFVMNNDVLTGRVVRVIANRWLTVVNDSRNGINTNELGSYSSGLIKSISFPTKALKSREVMTRVDRCRSILAVHRRHASGHDVLQKTNRSMC